MSATSMKFCNPARFVSAALLLAVSGTAAAHPFHPMGAGFNAGFAHPFAGLDHLLAMIAVGLWAVQFDARWVWAIPLAFVTAMLAGGALGFAGVTLPLVEPMIAASVLALGLLTVLRIRLHAAGIVLVAAFALFHGIAHGIELPAAAGVLPYAAGFALATALLHGLGLLAGLQMKIAARWAGAPIALAGGWLLLSTMV
jgi:urease accessory protein